MSTETPPIHQNKISFIIPESEGRLVQSVIATLKKHVGFCIQEKTHLHIKGKTQIYSVQLTTYLPDNMERYELIDKVHTVIQKSTWKAEYFPIMTPNHLWFKRIPA